MMTLSTEIGQEGLGWLSLREANNQEPSDAPAARLSNKLAQQGTNSNEDQIAYR